MIHFRRYSVMNRTSLSKSESLRKRTPSQNLAVSRTQHTNHRVGSEHLEKRSSGNHQPWQARESTPSLPSPSQPTLFSTRSMPDPDTSADTTTTAMCWVRSTAIIAVLLDGEDNISRGGSPRHAAQLFRISELKTRYTARRRGREKPRWCKGSVF